MELLGSSKWRFLAPCDSALRSLWCSRRASPLPSKLEWTHLGMCALDLGMSALGRCCVTAAGERPRLVIGGRKPASGAVVYRGSLRTDARRLLCEERSACCLPPVLWSCLSWASSLPYRCRRPWLLKIGRQTEKRSPLSIDTIRRIGEATLFLVAFRMEIGGFHSTIGRTPITDTPITTIDGPGLASTTFDGPGLAPDYAEESPMPILGCASSA